MLKIFASASLLTLAAASSATAAETTADGASAVDSVIVTATRSDDARPIELLGSSATVIGDPQMDERQVRVVSDVLRDVPGVAVGRTGGIGGMTSVRIRGAEGNHTLVLIDGIKASDPFYDEYDFGTLIADEDSRLEVLRGQQSSLYGSDAIGGVISYTTLSGAEAPGMKLRAEGGSFGTFSGGARAAGVSGNLDYALSTSYLRTDGYPNAVGGHRDVGSDSLGVDGKVIWTPQQNLRLTAVGRYSHTAADLDDPDNDSTSPTYGQTIDTPGVRYVNDGFYGLLNAQLDSLGGKWTNSATAQIADTERTGYDVPDIYSPFAGQPIIRNYGDHGRRVKGSFVSAYRFGDDHVRQRVTVAVDAERDSERATYSQFGAYMGWRHSDNVGLVGEYNVTVDDRLAIDVSLRRDFNYQFADATTYHVDASYRFDSGTRLHAASGSGVKAPSLSDLYDYYAGHYVGNPNLKPEYSVGWEAGIEQNLLRDRVRLDATYFDNRLTDVITTAYPGGVATPVNLAGKTHQRGVELTAGAQISADWRLDADYTYVDAPQDRSAAIGGLPVTFHGQAVRRAKNIASANLTWAPANGPFSGTLTVRYNGPQYDLAYVDPNFGPPTLVTLKAFTLVNLGASYKVSRHFEVYGRIENLLNQKYFEVYSFATAGIAGYGGVKYRF